MNIRLTIKLKLVNKKINIHIFYYKLRDYAYFNSILDRRPKKIKNS